MRAVTSTMKLQAEAEGTPSRRVRPTLTVVQLIQIFPVDGF